MFTLRSLLFIILTLLALAWSAQASDLIRVEPAGDRPSLVVIENGFYRLAVDPSRGAAAVSLIVKPSGTEMLLPDADAGAGLFADVFRDEGFAGQWRGAYDVAIDPPGRVTFSRRGTGAGPVRQVTVSKTLTVAPDSPAIGVTVEIRMADGEARHFPFRYWVHNRVGRADATMHYFLPALKGVESFSFTSGAAGGSQQHTVIDPPRPWLAAVADDGAALAVRFDQPHPQTLYSYAKARVATLEWGHEQVILRRGQAWTSSFTLLTFTGLPRVDGVVGSAAGAIVADADGAPRGRVLLTGAEGPCDVDVRYCVLPDHTWHSLAASAVTLVPGQVESLPFDLGAAAAGTVVVRAELRRGGNAIGQFERDFTFGAPTGRYVMTPLVRKTDQLGPTSRQGAIALTPGRAITVEKLLPTDCRLVRGFAHAPVDGRTDTRNSEGGVSEWTGAGGLPAVNYSEFNGSNGLHIALPDGGFDAAIIRGGWAGKVYADYDSLTAPPPDAPAFCNVEPQAGVFRLQTPTRTAARRLSFFAAAERTGPLADVTFLRIAAGGATDGQAAPLGVGAAIEPDAKLHEALEMKFGPFYRAAALVAAPGQSLSLEKGEFIHLLTPPQDPTQGVAVVTVDLRVAKVEPGALLTLRVLDVLDPRREAISADFTVPGPGDYRIVMDVPDQVFLPPPAQWPAPPRLDGLIAPEPVVCLSVAFDAPAEVAQVGVGIQHVASSIALRQAGAWRLFLLRGLFSTMSEPRPWMHLTDKGPFREQIATNDLMTKYALSLVEVLENAELARLLLPDDDVARQYHEWVYQNVDRRKPLPPPALPESGDPRWAALVRQSYIELRDIAQWWLDHRMTAGGYFGGGINDDTDLFQTWQCLPLIESDPLGARLKDAAEQLADNAWTLTLEKGINKRSMDALHAYEEGVNQLALCARWFYGDPVHFERAMICADSTMKLLVETPDGRVHFGGELLGIDQARSGFDKLGSAGGYATKLMLHPLYEVAWYNRNPAVLRRFEQWGRTWQGYQKPGAYVEHVDIVTGKPRATTAAARGPSDEWLALYHVTGDAAWLDPLKLGMLSDTYWGFDASYGRSAHVLVEWGEPQQSTLRSHAMAGYAGFFLSKDRARLDHWLATSASWFGRYRYMHTQAEQKTDRVLTYNASTPLACYLGDAPNRNRWVNLCAVSYEGLRGENFAALVWDAGGDRLKVALYNFTDQPLQAAMRAWRLDHGRYRITTGLDDNDGSIDEAPAQREAVLQRGSSLPLTLAPKRVTVIEVAQLERLGDIQGRADLALSRREIVIEGNSVRGVVHNIGSAPAEAVVAALAADGKVIAKLALGMLEAPLDLKPRTAAFVLDAPRCARIVVDLEDAVAEIYEANNSVTLDAKATHP